ncbi:MAG: hypothetical protein QM779_11685 [Propionicimonas sp.]|uniref:hypothetical protein n=1 Tax=Propionicimonas sp. TaxID=1955623 RepID=UPI003D1028ED
MSRVVLIPLKICPKAPPGAQALVDQVTGNVAWGVLAIFAIAGLVCIGAIAAGKLFGMHQASKWGVVGLCVVVIAAILYMIWPDTLNSLVGNGCI